MWDEISHKFHSQLHASAHAPPMGGLSLHALVALLLLISIYNSKTDKYDI